MKNDFFIRKQLKDYQKMILERITLTTKITTGPYTTAHGSQENNRKSLITIIICFIVAEFFFEILIPKSKRSLTAIYTRIVHSSQKDNGKTHKKTSHSE